MAACGLGLGLAAVACTAGPGSSSQPGAPPSTRPSSIASPVPRPLALSVTPAAYQLPSAIAREVVLGRGPYLLIVGGLTQQGTTTGRVIRLNPVTGQATLAGALPDPTHDAAGAVLAGRPYVFGGGGQAIIAGVQELGGNRTATVAGQLPVPRADLSAVTLGTTAYVIGGFDGATYASPVLATSDGRHFRAVARLPVPVRYAAVAGVGNRIWVFGGETPSGLTSAIQQINLSTGQATVVGHLPAPLFGATGFTLGGRVFIAGGQAARHGQLTTRGWVLAYHAAKRRVTIAGRLPVPVSNAAAAVLGGTAYLVGGSNGQRQVPTVTRLRLVAAPASPAAPTPSVFSASQLTGGVGAGVGADLVSGPGSGALSGGTILAGQPWLKPVPGPGYLAPHSDPSVLPGDVLIADNGNNRLLIVDPQGRIRWKFPQPGDLAPGQTFLHPDDAFFSPNGRYVIATQEDNSVVSVIDIARHKIVYRYGTPGVPGSTANHVSNPDDAMMMPAGGMIMADIKNCRILLLAPPARQLHRPRRIIGSTGACWHNPPQDFGSPNGAFPATNGNWIVTEINNDWATEMSLSGHVAWSVHPPGVAYPSDTNEVYPGRYLTTDYSSFGQVVEFNSRGRLLWRFGGLNHPSLALPLPNGDILVNDDYNHRVIVIDPTTNRIVWQYGHTGVAGTGPGYLNDPDGVDLTPPDSLLITHAPTMGQP